LNESLFNVEFVTEDLPMNKVRLFSSPTHEWFSYNLHDLKAPLGRISKLLHPLESLSPSDDIPHREELNRISQEIRKEVDDSLRLCSAISAHLALDDFRPTFSLLSVKDLIERVLPGLKIETDEKEIELDYRPQLADLQVKGEMDLLARALQNLVRNAIEYTPQFGFVGIEAVQNEGCLRLLISDSGPGIPESVRQWLFEPAFGTVPGVRSVLDGRGLGLALVSRIVALHGGQIYVEPNSGEGSRFIVELPSVHVLETSN
jgi:two-component system, OmpR family, phosphate regulon sensor histidine kinase PhoR